MNNHINILSAGMVTAVGLDRASSTAALRGGLDGFQETQFLSADGKWQLGAPVPLPRNWIGEKRIAHLAAGAITDALAGQSAGVEVQTIILCLSEKTRVGAPVRDTEVFAKKVVSFAGLSPSSKIEIVEFGRPSGFVALERARKILTKAPDEHVLIVGADSLLTGPAISSFIRQQRLLCPSNANGFLPGEAAAAILCTGGPATNFTMSGLGMAREKAFLYNDDDLPLRGDGMTNAYREAMEPTGLNLAGVEYRISDLTGEAYFFKQTALAALRLERGRTEFQDLWSPTEGIGNVGAASVPVMVAMALSAYEKGYQPGSPVLVEASGDNGTCGAAVFYSASVAA